MTTKILTKKMCDIKYKTRKYSLYNKLEKVNKMRSKYMQNL